MSMFNMPIVADTPKRDPKIVHDRLLVDITNRFTYHAPKGDQAERYGEIREKANTLALQLLSRCPDSRELSVALTKLDEVVFWANASIARNE